MQNELLPRTAYLRLPAIIGNRKTGRAGILPIASTTWWNGVKTGRFPKPVKIGPRITAWRVTDIEALIRKFDDAAQSDLPTLSFVHEGDA